MAFDPGDVWTPELTVRDTTGALVAATVVLSVLSPSGVTTTPTATASSLGVYAAPILLTEPGLWTATWTVSGAVSGVERQQISVRALDTLRWQPTPDDVHAIIPRRPAFTFTSDPSISDVQTIIDGLVADLATDAGTLITEKQAPLAKWAITLGAAAYVESAFFPEQNETDAGMSATLYRRYLDTLNRLRNVLGLSAEATGGSGGSGTNMRGAFTIGKLPADYQPPTIQVDNPNWHRWRTDTTF